VGTAGVLGRRRLKTSVATGAAPNAVSYQCGRCSPVRRANRRIWYFIPIVLTGAFFGPNARADGLSDDLKVCTRLPRDINAVRESLDKCRQLKLQLSTQVAENLPDASAKRDSNAALIAVGAAEERLQRELPAVSLGASNWSVTMQAFVGLLRVTFADKKTGTTDQFQPLSGVGSGVKFRRMTIDADQKAMEIVGFSAGLYYEPKVSVKSAAGNSEERTAQTLSAMVVLSTFERLYLGVGWKIASSEPLFDGGLHRRNFMVVFGLGADGKSL
jgi:hypothetical protein